MPSSAADSLSSPILFDPLEPSHKAFLPQFTELQIACVTTDHTLAMFLPPFTPSKRDVVLNKWLDYAEEVRQGNRDIFFITASSVDGSEEEAVGVVMLAYPFAETGPMRSQLEKLCVSPKHRSRGIARRLLAAVEQKAKEVGRTCISLSTEVGSPAEVIYPKLGFKKLGVIERWGISPEDRRLTDEVFFYKHLENEEEMKNRLRR